MSGLMQNLGAAALFLPVMTGISKREKISISSLLMPMGFAALLGGTLTMVGTSSLIVLNDLLTARGLSTFGLFSVLPIGLVLLVVGVGYFSILGPYVLPSGREESDTTSPGQKLLNVWGLSDTIYTFRVPNHSDLIGKSAEESRMGANYNINLLEVYDDEQSDYDIWREIRFREDQKIVVQGQEEDIRAFKNAYGLELTEEEDKSDAGSSGGYLEVVIPARSSLVGKTLRDVPLRETYNAQVVLFFSESEVVEEGWADRVIQAGDTMVLHAKWESLQFFKENEDFITVTPLEYESKQPEKAWLSVGSFAGAIGLVLALDLSISIGFLTGALAMILGGVLTIEEAYRSVEWKVVFLIAGLIPIGIAMEASGGSGHYRRSPGRPRTGRAPVPHLVCAGDPNDLFLADHVERGRDRIDGPSRARNGWDHRPHRTGLGPPGGPLRRKLVHPSDPPCQRAAHDPRGIPDSRLPPRRKHSVSRLCAGHHHDAVHVLPVGPRPKQPLSDE
jgi:Di- and tricarboxylate transporters